MPCLIITHKENPRNDSVLRPVISWRKKKKSCLIKVTPPPRSPPLRCSVARFGLPVDDLWPRPRITNNDFMDSAPLTIRFIFSLVKRSPLLLPESSTVAHGNTRGNWKQTRATVSSKLALRRQNGYWLVELMRHEERILLSGLPNPEPQSVF